MERGRRLSRRERPVQSVRSPVEEGFELADGFPLALHLGPDGRMIRFADVPLDSIRGGHIAGRELVAVVLD